MQKANTNATVRMASNTVGLIEIKGEVNAFSEETLAVAYNEANKPGVTTIVLDFSGLEYMNSSGIGLLVMLLIRAQRQKQKMIAIGLTSHYKQIFELTRLNEAFGIYDTEAQALAAA